MKYTIVIFFFILGTINVQGRSSCESMAKEMNILPTSEIGLEDATEVFENYLEKKCDNLLLAYNFLGFAHYNSANLDEAFSYLQLAEKEFFKDEKDIEQYAKNQIFTALAFILKKDFESAVYHLTKAKKFAEKTDNLYLQSTVYQNMGLAKIQMDELEEAEEYYEKAINIGGIDSSSLGYIYQNLALLHFKNENLEKSKEFVVKTKEIWEKLSHGKGLYLLSFIETQLALKEKAFNEAFKLLELGRTQYANEEKLLLGENYLIEAQIHGHLENLTAKRIALKNALLLSQDLSSEELGQAILDIASLQDCDQTIDILSILISDLKLQNRNLDKRNISESKLMDDELAEGESQIKKQLLYIFLLLGGLLVMSFLYVRDRRQKIHISKLNSELEARNAEVRNQLKLLEIKNKELKQFAYVASHDLKSPLNTISSFVSLAQLNIDDREKVNGYLDFITDASKKMTSMISDLLYHSTLEQKLEKKPTAIKELLDEVLVILEKDLKDAKAQISIDKVAAIQVNCEPNLISLVIQNLIVNGVNFCKEGEVPKIEIATEEDQSFMKLSIADQGIGIKKEHQNMVFDMFSRLNIKKVDGTGIGLATCKKIIESHGGTISVESDVDKGAVFTILIPKY